MKLKWIALGVVMLPLTVMAAPQTLNMKVDGMTCGSCVSKVKKALAPVCKEAKVDLKAATAQCTYDAPVTEEQVLAAAKGTGFTISKQK